MLCKGFCHKYSTKSKETEGNMVKNLWHIVDDYYPYPYRKINQYLFMCVCFKLQKYRTIKTTSHGKWMLQAFIKAQGFLHLLVIFQNWSMLFVVIQSMFYFCCLFLCIVSCEFFFILVCYFSYVSCDCYLYFSLSLQL